MNEELNLNKNLINDYDEVKKLTKKQCKTILLEINIAEDLEKENYNQVINYILIKYIEKKEEALESLKRKKLFSLDINSKNQFKIRLLDFLLKNKNKISLYQVDINYYQSKRNLAFASKDIYHISEKIKQKIKGYGQTLVRDLLYITDMGFHKGIEKNELFDIGVEDLSECCSFLIQLDYKINSRHIISNKTFSKLEKFDYKKINHLIYDTVLIKGFQNAEKIIDNFNYKCIIEQKNLIICSEDILLEKSRQYGYLHSNFQRLNQYLNQEEIDDILSLKTLTEVFLEASNTLFELRKEPFERYILKFPLFDEFKDNINQESFFEEEVHELNEIRKEYFLGWTSEEILNFKVSGSLTLKDLMLAQRINRIIANINSNFLYSKLEENPENEQIIYNSWIKVFSYKDLKSIYTEFIGEEKAKEFIDGYSWGLENSEKNDKLDLQYTPLLKYFEYYFPMNIMGNSNLFRNLLFKNNIRPQNEKEIDFISKVIKNIMKKNFEYVEEEVKFNQFGYVGDFDVIAYIDNTIYVFEAKNTIHPAGLHELRSTYEGNLKKALSQLDKCKAALSDKRFIEYLNTRFKWNIQDDFKIVTCVVLGNRMFNGYTNGEHHVRSSYELINFLSDGKINIQVNDKKEKISLWENDVICGKDIYNFIEKSTFHKTILNSAIAIEEKIKIGKHSLAFKTFEFDSHKLLEKISEL